MKNYFVIAFAVLFLAACNGTSTANVKTETFKVWGNCGMCKKTIEKSLKVNGIADADWNKDSKIMTVSFDSTAITLEQIQKNIAAAGYDTEQERGDDAAYANLHSCCQYERK
jgi:periplasmic mercuric ion binding protein